MILLCVANISMGSYDEGRGYVRTVDKLTEDEINELIGREADPFTLAFHRLVQGVVKYVKEDEEN